MNHLEPGGALTSVAEACDANPGLELCLLRSGEVKKSQRELTAAVGDADQQVAAPPIDGLGEQNLAAYEAARTCNQRTEPDELRSVLVAQRQQKEQVLDPEKAEPLELDCERGPDALENRQRRRRVNLFLRHCWLAHNKDRVRFYVGAFGQRCDTQCRTCRIRHGEVVLHDSIYRCEVIEIGQINGQLDDLI